MSKKNSIAFIHPDLGIGGAERLIVDIAVGLQQQGHSLVIFTSHYSKQHCFPETLDLNIQAHGDRFIPRHCFGYFFIIMAMLKNLYLCLAVWLQTLFYSINFDLIFVDQLSIGIPILKWTGAKIVFYCHFPDQLLAKRTSTLRRIYRFPFDALEAYTTNKADLILVNSKYTQSVFHQIFPTIHKPTFVVYPTVSESITVGSSEISNSFLSSSSSLLPNSSTQLFLSINRFEMKKKIQYAIQAYHSFAHLNTLLIIAGGYDSRVHENHATLEYLQAYCESLQLPWHTFSMHDLNSKTPLPSIQRGSVVFLLSISESLKQTCLKKALCLLYTPPFEHFGIVPLEAMNQGVPVIAMNNGGPSETVRHEITGYLCDEPEAFEKGLHWCMSLTPSQREKVKQACQAWVRSQFTRKQMIFKLETLFSKLLENK